MSGKISVITLVLFLGLSAVLVDGEETDAHASADAAPSPNRMTRSNETDRPRPAVPSAGGGSQCFYTTADASVRSDKLNTNNGTAAELEAIQTDQHDSRLFLKFDLSQIASGSTIVSATLKLNQVSGTAGSYELRGVDSDWSETAVTWNNQPGTSNIYDQQSHDDSTGWKTWDAVPLVHEWVNGVRTNHGLAIVPYGFPVTDFAAREYDEGLTTDPRLCLTWTDETISTDLAIDDIEVTQAVQDLDGRVALVADKRTFVRLHVRSTGGDFRSYARLVAIRGGDQQVLSPINPDGRIVVRSSPDRAVLNHAFLFELPSYYTEGDVILTAQLNPATGWRNRYPPETNYGNNSQGISVSFQEVPEPSLVVYRGKYTIDSTTYETDASDVTQLVDWLESAFPVPSVRLLPMRVEDYGEGSVPTCDDANALLYLRAAWDNVYDADVEFGKTRYYAMVDDGGGFMRGCSANRPGFVASGPTGTPGSGSWDTDGSYGDWYGAHELGHSYGRRHTRGEVPLVGPGDCGDERGPDPSYPYWEGYISGDSDGDSALFGFDSRSQAIYGPQWRDVMSYCDNLWISDYTYEKLMDFFQNNLGRSAVSRSSAPMDRLLVVGTINPETSSADLQPLFVMPNAEALDPRLPGDHAIVLRNESGSELARYPFTPAAIHNGPPDPGDPWHDDTTLMAINEMVPYVDGTTQVEVEGPDGGVLTSVSAGASAPTVTLTAPNGGETIVGDTTVVTWTASDADDDSLHFDLQYSDDNGNNWQMVAQNLSGNSVELSTDNLTGADQGLFRIWVSDGIHTASDESDDPFTVPNRDPEIEILSPSEGTVIATDQTLNLQGRAYDGDTGLMPDDQIRWFSNQDGVFGFGPQLSVAGLSPGQHIISFFADDNNGGFAWETVEITVVPNLTLVPPQSDALEVGPSTILLEPKDGLNSAQISVDNHIHTNAITWQATADQPWLQLSATAGTTPGNVAVTVQETDLEPGSHAATITVTSADVPGQSIDIRVVATIPGEAVYLPTVIK